MRPELETYEQIDLFLRGKLKGQALNSFQERMQKDADFAEEVQLQKFANDVIVGASFQDLRDQMSADISKIDSSAASSKWKFISIGLGAIVISSSILYFSPTKETAQEKQTSNSNVQTSIQKVKGVRSEEKVKLSAIKENTEQPILKEFKHSDSTLLHQVHIQQRLKDSIPSVAIKHAELIQPKNIEPAKQEDPTTSLNPCAGTNIVATISTSASCADKHTGSILIPQSDIKGGKAPYTIRLDKSKIGNTFHNLAASDYLISIIDQQGCIKTYSVEVKEKECNATPSVFAPDKGEVWKYIGNSDLSYTLTIINIAGQQVYKTAQIQGVFDWQGYSQKGEYLEAGLYIYIAEYSDGSKENGQVTIAR